MNKCLSDPTLVICTYVVAEAQLVGVVISFLLFWILCSHPGYFGKVGMRHFHLTKNQYFCPVVNVERLWSLIPQQTKKELPTKETGNIPVLDVLDYVSVALFVCVHFH